jgi:hypothetical protein
MNLLDRKKDKYSELKTETLRRLESFINDYIESFVRDVELHQERFREELDTFKVSVSSIDPLDSPEDLNKKIDKSIISLKALDFPLRSNFYYEVIDQFNLLPIVSELADEVFQRVLFRLGVGDEYEKFSNKMNEVVDKASKAFKYDKDSKNNEE